MSTGLYDAVRDVAEQRPQAPAITMTDGTSVTYAELIETVDRVAGGLTEHGIAPESTVACTLTNRIGYVALILAAARLGARYVPLMANFDSVATDTAVDLARPALLVTDDHRPAYAQGVPTVHIDELTAATSAGPPPMPYGGIFRLLWTSGSTGFPKMMAWRQDKFVRERLRWIADVDITTDDVVFCRHTLDVAHATDLHVFAALLAGAHLILADQHATPTTLLAQIVHHRVTAMSALPQHYDDLVSAAGSDTPDLSRLRRPMCGGAYLAPGIVRRADAVLGIRIRQIYGSTEFGLALGDMRDVVQDEGWLTPVAGVGTRLEPMVEGHPDIGELVLLSDCTSEGYLNNDDAHRRTFRDGEFWTGDIAERGPSGALRVRGRVSEALAARSGPLPAPVLDGEIAGTGAVTVAASLAVHPGEYRAEVLVAVVAAPGYAHDDVQTAVKDVLAGHGLDGEVRILDTLPRTPVGKVDKPGLRSRMGMTGGSR